jgi:hypothetical protein
MRDMFLCNDSLSSLNHMFYYIWFNYIDFSLLILFAFWPRTWIICLEPRLHEQLVPWCIVYVKSWYHGIWPVPLNWHNMSYDGLKPTHVYYWWVWTIQHLTLEHLGVVAIQRLHVLHVDFWCFLPQFLNSRSEFMLFEFAFSIVVQGIPCPQLEMKE